MNGYAVLNWDLSLIIAPLLIVIFGVVPTVVLYARWKSFGSPRYILDDGQGYLFFARVMAGLTAVALVVMVLALIPFQSRYWKWYAVPAHVTAVSNTLRDASGDLTTTPVVTAQGIAQPLIVDDPRIVTMTGHDITLSCSPQWHYRAADTIYCRIYSLGGTP